MRIATTNAPRWNFSISTMTRTTSGQHGAERVDRQPPPPAALVAAQPVADHAGLARA